MASRAHAVNKGGVRHNTARYVKKKKRPVSRVPPLQKVRILNKSAAGKSARQIAKEENRALKTVLNIVNSKEMQEQAEEYRLRMFSRVGAKLIDRVEDLVDNKKSKDHAWIVVEIAEQLGILPGKIKRLQPVLPVGYKPPQQSDEEERVATIVARLTQTAMERGKIFGMPMPEVDDIKHEIEIPLGKEK
jgi:hypothetical protein